MTSILCTWLNEELKLSKPIETDRFAEAFCNGYLLGEILHRHGLQDNLKAFVRGNTVEAKTRNMTLLEPTLRLLHIPFDIKTARDLMEARSGLANRLVQQVYVALQRMQERGQTATSLRTARGDAKTLSDVHNHDRFAQLLVQSSERQTDVDMREKVDRRFSAEAQQRQLLLTERERAQREREKSKRTEEVKRAAERRREAKRAYDKRILQQQQQQQQQSFVLPSSESFARYSTRSSTTTTPATTAFSRSHGSITSRRVSQPHQEDGDSEQAAIEVHESIGAFEASLRKFGIDPDNSNTNSTLDSSATFTAQSPAVLEPLPTITTTTTAAATTTPPPLPTTAATAATTTTTTKVAPASSSLAADATMTLGGTDHEYTDEYIERIRERKRDEELARREREKRRRKAMVDEQMAVAALEEAQREEMLLAKLMRQSMFERGIAAQLMQTRQEKDAIRQNRLLRERQIAERRQREYEEALVREAQLAALAREQHEREVEQERSEYEAEVARQQSEERAQHTRMCRGIVLEMVAMAQRLAEYRVMVGGAQFVPSKLRREWHTLFVAGESLEYKSGESADNTNHTELCDTAESLLRSFDFDEYCARNGEWSASAEPNVDTDNKCSSTLMHCLQHMLDYAVPTPSPPPPPVFPNFPIRAALTGKPFTGKSEALNVVAPRLRLTVIRVLDLVREGLEAHDRQETQPLGDEARRDRIAAAAREAEQRVRALKMPSEAVLKSAVSVEVDPWNLESILQCEMPPTRLPAKVEEEPATTRRSLSSRGKKTSPMTSRKGSRAMKPSERRAADEEAARQRLIDQEAAAKKEQQRVAEEAALTEAVAAVEAEAAAAGETAAEEARQIAEQTTVPTTLAQLGSECAQLLREGREVSDALLVQLVAERVRSLGREEATSLAAGWVLDGFPQTREQARLLEETLSGYVEGGAPSTHADASVSLPGRATAVRARRRPFKLGEHIALAADDDQEMCALLARLPVEVEDAVEDADETVRMSVQQRHDELVAYVAAAMHASREQLNDVSVTNEMVASQAAQLLVQAIVAYDELEALEDAAETARRVRLGAIQAAAEARGAAEPWQPEPIVSGLDAVVLVSVDDEAVRRRALGRRLDPQTGHVYHLELDPPGVQDQEGTLVATESVIGVHDRLQRVNDANGVGEQLRARLVQYRREESTFEKWFRPFETLRLVDGEAPQTTVTERIEAEIKGIVERKLERERLRRDAAAKALEAARHYVDNALDTLEERLEQSRAAFTKRVSTMAVRLQPQLAAAAAEAAAAAASPRKRSIARQRSNSRGKKTPVQEEKPLVVVEHRVLSAIFAEGGPGAPAPSSPSRRRRDSPSRRRASTPTIDTTAAVRELPLPVRRVSTAQRTAEERERNRFVANTHIDEREAHTLLVQWQELEDIYVDGIASVLAQMRHERERTWRYFHLTRCNFQRFLARPDDKQLLVDTWLDEYARVDEDMRDDAETKAELHARIEDLRDALWSLCDERRRESDEELRAVMQHGWLAAHLAIVGTLYLRLAQFEADRFQETAQLLDDYFCGVAEAREPHALSETVTITAQLASVTFDDASGVTSEEQQQPESATAPGTTRRKHKMGVSGARDSAADAVAVGSSGGAFSAGPAVSPAESGKVQLARVREGIAQARQVVERRAEFARWIGREMEEKQRRKLEVLEQQQQQQQKRKGSRAGSRPLMRDRDEGTTEEVEEEEETEEQREVKERLKREHSEAIAAETARLEEQLNVLEQHAVETVALMTRNAAASFTLMDQWLGERFRLECASVATFATTARAAVEAEAPLAHRLVLDGATFYIDRGTLVHALPVAPAPVPPIEIVPESTPLRFSVAQLTGLLAQLRLVALYQEGSALVSVAQVVRLMEAHVRLGIDASLLSAHWRTPPITGSDVSSFALSLPLDTTTPLGALVPCHRVVVLLSRISERICEAEAEAAVRLASALAQFRSADADRIGVVSRATAEAILSDFPVLPDTQQQQQQQQQQPEDGSLFDVRSAWHFLLVDMFTTTGKTDYRALLRSLCLHPSDGAQGLQRAAEFFSEPEHIASVLMHDQHPSESTSAVIEQLVVSAQHTQTHMTCGALVDCLRLSGSPLYARACRAYKAI